MSYQKIVAAIGAELQRRYADAIPQDRSGEFDPVKELVSCQEAMPDFLRHPMRLLTWIFDWWGLVSGGRRFQNLDVEHQAAQLDAWRNSRLEFCRNFVRFYESYFLLAVMQEDAE